MADGYLDLSTYPDHGEVRTVEFFIFSKASKSCEYRKKSFNYMAKVLHFSDRCQFGLDVRNRGQPETSANVLHASFSRLGGVRPSS